MLQSGAWSQNAPAFCAHQDKVKLITEYLNITLFCSRYRSVQQLLLNVFWNVCWIPKRLCWGGVTHINGISCLFKAVRYVWLQTEFWKEQKEKHTFARRLLFGQVDWPVSQSGLFQSDTSSSWDILNKIGSILQFWRDLVASGRFANSVEFSDKGIFRWLKAELGRQSVSPFITSCVCYRSQLFAFMPITNTNILLG